MLLAAALLLVGAVVGAQDRPRLVGAPVTIDDANNDEGLQRALEFAMAEYNRASNDMYSSRVVRIISAKRQVGARGGTAPRRDGLGNGGGRRGGVSRAGGCVWWWG